MSLLAPAPPALDWWYVRVYPGSAHALDAAVAAVVPWARRQAEAVDAHRWFFMRYLDMTGQHVRLRIQAAPDAVDRLHTLLPEVDALVRDLPEARGGRRLLAGADLGELPGPRAVRPALYTPELEKYGGPAGSEVALDLFATASAWYDDHDVTALAQAGPRTALALEYQQRLVAAALPVAEHPAFWAAHRAQWGWQLRRLLPTRADLEERSRDLLRMLDQVRVPAGPAAGLEDLVGAVVTALDRAAVVAPHRPRARLLLELLHMDMNRWGLMPAEECLVGVVAAGRPPAAPSPHHLREDAS